jgi:hypothetical protein
MVRDPRRKIKPKTIYSVVLYSQYLGCAIVFQPASRGTLVSVVARSRETRVDASLYLQEEVLSKFQ